MKRIVNMRRFIISNTILLLIIFMGISALINVTYSYNITKYKTIFVSKGDTLWNIAISEKENNEHYKNKDIRDIVYDIKEINNLNNCSLDINQELKIPIN